MMDPFQRKTLWIVALLLVGWGVYVAQEALFVLFGAFILASAMSPLVELLDRKLPRWAAVLIPFLIFLTIGLGVILPVGEMAIQQLQWLISDLPKVLEQVRVVGDEWTALGRRYPILSNIRLEQMVSQISTQGLAVFSGFTGATLVVSKILLNVLTSLIISYFLLLDREKIQNYCLRLLSPSGRGRADALLSDLIRSTGAFVNGQLLFMASFAFLIFLGLSWLELPFALLFALAAGVLTLIPIIGPNIVLVPTMGFAYVNSGDPMQALWVLLLFVAVQVVENNFVGPVIMGKAVGLHPLAIILAIMVGGLLFGLTGIILAIPLTACLKILMEAWLFPDIEATVPEDLASAS
jgi:predicted PurR-regulated permease PerM